MSNVIPESILCATLSSSDASTFHVQDMQIIECDIIAAWNQT